MRLFLPQAFAIISPGQKNRFQGRMNKKNRTNVVGIDFGTSNTYLTVCPYGTKNKFPIHLGNRSPAIDTAILYADGQCSGLTGFPVIGERATVTYGQASLEDKAAKGYRYHANFKPEIAVNGAARACAVDFFKAIRKEATRVGVNLIPEEDLVIIGVPSQSSPQFRETLRGVLQEAGLGTAEVVDEPKGVLLTDLGYNRLPLADILGGCLVVDFGGGTCDFAMMRRGEVVASWGDMELGGRLFDDLFYQWFLEQNPGAGKSLAKERREFYVLSYSCRLLKEDFSETVARDPGASVSAEVGRFGVVRDMTAESFMARAAAYRPSEAFVGFAEAMGMGISARLGAGPVDIVGWFTDLLTEGLKDMPVKAISFSGGSSKWFFVKEICQRILKIEPSKIMASPNPFGAISEGLAILPAVMNGLETVRGKMVAGKDAFIRTELMPRVEESLAGCAERLADRITAELFDGLITPVLRASRDRGLKLSEVEDEVQDSIDGYRKELAVLAENETNLAIGGLKAILQTKVQQWLDTFGLRLEGHLPSKAAGGGQIEIARPLVADNLAGPLVALANGLVSAWTSLLAASICGGTGIALLHTGPLGLILGALGGLGMSHLGLRLGHGRIQEMVKKRRIPGFLARKFLSDNKIAKVRGDFMKDVVAKIALAYREVAANLPGELDEIITNEINQLGIINIL
jgi:hypothetical protein